MKIFKAMLAIAAATSIVGVTVFAHAGESKESEPSGHHQHFKSDKDSTDVRPKHRHRDGKHEFFDDLLNLTDTQKQTLDAARTAREPAVKETREKLRAAYKALNEAGDQNADDATLSKLSSDLATIIAQQEIARIKEHREFISVLTPEQKEKLVAFKAEHKGPSRWKHNQRAVQ